MKKIIILLAVVSILVPSTVSAFYFPPIDWCQWFPWLPQCQVVPPPTPTPTPTPTPEPTPVASSLRAVQVTVTLDLTGIASASDFSFFVGTDQDRFNANGVNTYTRQISRRHAESMIYVAPVPRDGWNQSVDCTREDLNFLCTIFAVKFE